MCVCFSSVVYIYIYIYVCKYVHVGVLCHWLFNYPGPLLSAEFEFACSSG